MNNYYSQDTYKKILIELPFENIVQEGQSNPNPQSTKGIDLRYEPIYDQIRQAIKEEDDGLSRGIWDTNLKHADWPLAQKLCLDALTKQTKDLQILGWLLKARTNIYGLDGLLMNFTLLLDFCDKFWESMYPIIDQDNQKINPDFEIYEHRIKIIEWIIQMWADQIMTMPINNPDNHILEKPLTLYGWQYAINLDKISKRGPEGIRAYKEAIKNGLLPLEKFRLLMESIPYEFLLKKIDLCNKINDQINKLEKFFDDKIPGYQISFLNLKKHFIDIIRIYEGSIKTITTTDPQNLNNLSDQNKILLTEENTNNHNSPPPQSSNPVSSNQNPKIDNNEQKVIHDRKTAYIALGEISNFLEKLDPHSPSPQFLKLITSWENKTLPQILSSIEKQPQELKSFIKILASHL